MCKNLSEPGGYRCAIHMKGSRAVIKSVAMEANVTEKEAKAAFKALRKEGSKLETPTAEEVRAFTEMKRLEAKFSKARTNYESTILQRQWSEAGGEAAEHVDGGTFHAWKNIGKEVLQRAKPKLMALGVSGVLSVSIAACGSTSDLPPVSSEPIPTGESVVTETDASAYALTFDKHDEYKISTDGSITRVRGDGTEYNPLTISENSPALQLENVEIYEEQDKSDLYDKYSKEDIQDAVTYFSQMSITDFLDSEATYSHDMNAKVNHFKELRSNMTPSLIEDLKAKNDYKMLTNMKIDDVKKVGVNIYKAEGDTSPNVSIAQVQVGNLGVNEYGRLHFTVRVLADAVMDYKNPDTGKYENITEIRFLQDRTFFLVKDKKGEWKIDGIRSVDDAIEQTNWTLIDGDRTKVKPTPEVLPSRSGDRNLGASLDDPDGDPIKWDK